MKELERIKSKRAFINLLDRLLRALRGGKRLTVMVKGRRITIPADATMSVVHEAEEGEHEVEVQWRWKE